jgi:hypothetical protein
MANTNPSSPATRILFVDNEPYYRSEHRRELGERGISVTSIPYILLPSENLGPYTATIVCTNPNKGSELFRSCKEVVGRLKQTPSERKVIVGTSFTRTSSEFELLEREIVADGYISFTDTRARNFPDELRRLLK